jgi:hypothetical protein
VNDLVERARAHAVQNHARINQRLKYSLQPYDVHLKAVADLVASVTDDPETIAAAWLHDTLEDTPTTFEDLSRDFGSGVACLVTELTDISKPSDGNRAARKEIDCRHLALASPRAKTVKLADLIVNSQDICKHDERFGRVYIVEMMALLAVLHEGDAILYERAGRVVEKCARTLGVSETSSLSEHSDLDLIEPLPQEIELFSRYRGVRLLIEAFTARDIFEPLLSFDGGGDPEGMRQACGRHNCSVVGIREEGSIVGYLLSDDLHPGSHVPVAHPILPQQTVQLEDSLSDVIHVLSCFSYCFVLLDGSIIGVVGRPNVEKPVVRMWLFGMIILVEMVVVESIRRHLPDGAWQEYVSEGRLSKARQLLEERTRRKLGGDLLDCLQFSDKMAVAMLRVASFKESGFASAAATKKVIKEMESLRNNLAHGQDITSNDWPQIIRMTRRLHMLLKR